MVLRKNGIISLSSIGSRSILAQEFQLSPLVNASTPSCVVATVGAAWAINLIRAIGIEERQRACERITYFHRNCSSQVIRIESNGVYYQEA